VKIDYANTAITFCGGRFVHITSCGVQFWRYCFNDASLFCSRISNIPKTHVHIKREKCIFLVEIYLCGVAVAWCMIQTTSTTIILIIFKFTCEPYFRGQRERYLKLYYIVSNIKIWIGTQHTMM